MRIRVGSWLLLVLANGCQPDSTPSTRFAGSGNSGEGCEWLSAPEADAADVPICGLDFREVVRLEGTIDATIPNAPVRVLRDGTFITGTYSRGKLALWGRDGALLDVLGIHADGAGLIWVAAQMPGPDAPRQPPDDLDAPVVPYEEGKGETRDYTDHVIEALTPDGRLVASVRFDSPADVPYPVAGNLWYRPTPDRLSIVVLEVLLTVRGSNQP
ncbi:MAG: hypothetical protein F4139_11130 [Gemmatimonadetes bacterium]|nr:hypothetical protein [Gemmatimonadota bacterium]MYH53473.1 hypothetical protein [Gemmatimonadota bacterium]MYK67279.1 hypothetical protein [Gemmatimonadota bacterium]